LQKSRKLQSQGVRGCSCSVLPQTLGNAECAVCLAFQQGKKHTNFFQILEFTQGRFQIFTSNFSKVVRILSFLPPWHVFYATTGLSLFMAQDLPHLLRLMLDDMSKASRLYRPTHHWQGVVNELIETIKDQGVGSFRSLPAFLQAFVPNYAFPGYYGEADRYNGMYKALADVFPTESKLEKSQKTTTHSKFNIRLTDLLSGRMHALSDYRVFLASYSNHPPYTDKSSESQVGNPLEQFNFDGRRYSRSFLNYLIGLNYLKSTCLPRDIYTVLEIGGGYGSLGEILLSDQRNDCFYINVDIPPTSYVATYYLQKVFGDSEVGGYSRFRGCSSIEIDEIKEKFKAVVICPWQLPHLKGQIDLFVNYHSFAEMEPDVVRNYCRLVHGLQPRYILLRNLREGKQVVKSPGGFGVKTPILGKDYDRFLPGYKIVGINTIPFGFKTEDGFHSELRVYKKSEEYNES